MKISGKRLSTNLVENSFSQQRSQQGSKTLPNALEAYPDVTTDCQTGLGASFQKPVAGSAACENLSQKIWTLPSVDWHEQPPLDHDEPLPYVPEQARCTNDPDQVGHNAIAYMISTWLGANASGSTLLSAFLAADGDVRRQIGMHCAAMSQHFNQLFDAKRTTLCVSKFLDYGLGSESFARSCSELNHALLPSEHHPPPPLCQSPPARQSQPTPRTEHSPAPPTNDMPTTALLPESGNTNAAPGMSTAKVIQHGGRAPTFQHTVLATLRRLQHVFVERLMRGLFKEILIMHVGAKAREDDGIATSRAAGATTSRAAAATRSSARGLSAFATMLQPFSSSLATSDASEPLITLAAYCTFAWPEKYNYMVKVQAHQGVGGVKHADMSIGLYISKVLKEGK
eukprot:gene14032-19970_t